MARSGWQPNCWSYRVSMLDLRIMLAIAVFIFLYIGSRRGFSQEIIAMAGILLALFGLHQFDDFLRGELLREGSPLLHLLVQLLLFIAIVFFSYHTRAIIGTRAMARRTGELLSRRSNVQEGVLGGFIGAINGYLIGGSVWYFAHINDYPFLVSEQITVSPETIRMLPLYLLVNGPAGNGELLTVLVFGIFLIVLIMI